MSKNNSILKGAIILSIAGIITRLLGFVYRVYLAKIIGAEGMGLYQLVIPVYLVCHTTCTTGIFVTCSKLIAAANGKNTLPNSRKIIRIATIISVTMATITAIFTYHLAGFISTSLISEPRTYNSIKILAISLPFTSLVSMAKSYFYGTKNSIEPAFSQLFEQTIKMVIIYFLAITFSNGELEFVCMLVVAAIFISEVLAGAFDYLFYFVSRPKIPNNFALTSTNVLLKDLSKHATPLTLNRLLITLLSSIEVILIPARLQVYGLTVAGSLKVYGALTGMAFPLIFFPSVFTGALSMLLLPSVSEAQAANKSDSIKYTSSKTIQISSIIGIYSCCLFLFFGQKFGWLTFKNVEVGQYLIILSWLCPIMYVEGTLVSILNGLGETFETFKHSLLSAVIKTYFIFFAIPIFGIKAYL